MEGDRPEVPVGAPKGVSMLEGNARRTGWNQSFGGNPSRLKVATATTLAAVGILVSFGSFTAAYAADRNGNSAVVHESASVKRVVVTLNKSRTFNVETPFTRAIVAGPEIADVLPLSDRSVYVQGKK